MSQVQDSKRRSKVYNPFEPVSTHSQVYYQGSFIN